jgi:Fe(3+) dicitrate transport protein
MNRLLLYLSLTAFSTVNFLPAFSQTNLHINSYGAIRGKVYDAKTNENLVGVNVYLMNTTHGDASNAAGKFEITNLTIGDYTIVASMIGYETKHREVSIEADSTVEMNIQLSEILFEVGDGNIDAFGKTYEFPQVEIIGSRPSLVNRIPGSANVITRTSLDYIKPVTGNEMFKKVSGINVVDEEGAGLRANIGIRGLDPDRSRTVLMMEDGVPIALAPYGEPEMYYSPAIDRMNRIEVLKGSGSILYGPQTIGGVINYITNDPPLYSRFALNVKGSENGVFTGMTSYGTTINNVGFNVGFLHKQAEKLGVTRYNINDITAKLKFQTGSNSQLGIKLAIYDESSNSTYVGLTQSMYDNGEYFTIIAPNDDLDIRRYSANLSHDYFFSNNLFLRTTLYGYTTTRNWLRQDFSRDPDSDETGEVFGDTSVPGGAIYMKNSTGNRNRQFEVAGIEPRLNLNYLLGEFKNELEGGIRFHYERAFEQRVNGEKADAQSGAIKNDEIRTGKAVSIFAQNRIYITNNLILTPGLRFENFNYERDIFRLNYIDTIITNNSNSLEVIPGIGINYNINNNYSFFAGVHKGYAPPRIKDAITSDGESLELNAESSWNYELGLRANVYSVLTFELTGFVLDFSNQIIPVSESSGGTGTGLVNGGETLHLGLETVIRLNFHEIFKSDYLISFAVNSTFVNSEYSADRFININNERINIKYNRLPYSPDFTFTGLIDFSAPFGAGVHFAASYVNYQFTDELNTIEPAPSGETGKMPAYLLLDITGSYDLSYLNSTLYISVKNLLDERYIASRRPQGIKVGLPRFITVGVELTL